MATKSFIRSLYPSSATTAPVPIADDAEHTPAMDEDVTGPAAEIVAECLKLLSEPEKSQATYAAQVLSAFLSTTPAIAAYTLSQTIPMVLKVFRDPDEAPNRRPLLVHLAALIEAARESTLVKDGAPPLLEAYKDEVLGTLTTGLKSSSAPPSLDGLRSMILTPGLLNDEEMRYVVHSVNDLLSPSFSLSSTPRENDLTDEATDGALALLTTIASPLTNGGVKHVESLTLPLLFAALPDVPPKREEEAERQRAWHVLEFLGKLCAAPTLFDTLVVRLLAKVDLVLSALPAPTVGVSAAEGTGEREPGVAYAHAALHTIANVLDRKVSAKDADVARHVHKLVPHLYGLFIASALSQDAAGTIASEERLVAVTGRIIGLVVRVTPAP
jgi:DNA repair/transcription protein MET18/MMS19